MSSVTSLLEERLVSQSGWGEFDAKIQVFFIDPTERVLEMFHMLRLYKDGQRMYMYVQFFLSYPHYIENSANPFVKKPVISEIYDEIIFNEPTVSFYDLLVKGPSPSNPTTALKNEIAAYFNEFSGMV